MSRTRDPRGPRRGSRRARGIRWGRWWPDAYPGVVGVRDVRAGGAWLAADPTTRRLAVLLNREDLADLPEDEVVSRGGVVLESVAGRSPGDAPPTHGFNLVEVDGPRVAVTTWNGVQVARRSSSRPART